MIGVITWAHQLVNRWSTWRLSKSSGIELIIMRTPQSICGSCSKSSLISFETNYGDLSSSCSISGCSAPFIEIIDPCSRAAFSSEYWNILSRACGSNKFIVDLKAYANRLRLFGETATRPREKRSWDTVHLFQQLVTHGNRRMLLTSQATVHDIEHGRYERTSHDNTRNVVIVITVGIHRAPRRTRHVFSPMDNRSKDRR